MLSGFYLPSAGRLPARRAGAGRAQAPCSIARAGIARTYQTSQLFGSLSVRGQRGAGDAPRPARARCWARTLLRRRRCASARAQLLALCGYAGRARHAGGRPAARRPARWSRSPARWPPTPTCCCSTSRPPACRAKTRRGWRTLLRRIADAGIGVLLVEHDMTLVMDISRPASWCSMPASAWRVGTPAEMQADPAVRQAYLGEAAAGRSAPRRARAADSARDARRGRAGRRLRRRAGAARHRPAGAARRGGGAAGRQRRRQVHADARAGGPAPAGAAAASTSKGAT